MEDAESNKRRADRIPDHHVVRVKQIGPSEKKTWDVCIIKNASKTGILFYSATNYEHGSKVEIRISNPILHGEIICHARVARCLPLAGMHSMYGVALDFTDMSQLDSQAFEKMIELFLKRKKRDEDA